MKQNTSYMNTSPRTKNSLLSCIIAVISCFLFVFLTSFQKSTAKTTIVKQKKVLIFSKTNGYRHESILAGISAIKKLGMENHFLVDATEDSLDINTKNLKQYQAIIFLSTSGKVLGEKQKVALQNFIKKRKGFVGIHAATNCEPDWPWFVNMIGGRFDSHPAPQAAKLMVVNKEHPATKNLPPIWERKDEWYNFNYLNPNTNVLIKIDESSYTGGKHNNNHPLAWYHNYEGSKVFYTALGHANESYNEPLFLQHLLGGIQYAMELN